MRKIASLVFGIVAMSFSVNATTINSEESIFYGNNRKSYIFVVQNVEFSVFPDGQFDFTYIGDYNNTSITLNSPNINISYNSGYNYDMFIQYDEYGAVIQIENVPIYYDEYGRIAQAGEIEIRYSNRRIVRVGGLYVHYNYYGYYSHCTGFINPFNYHYVYRPWHTFYVRPLFSNCIVYNSPYRRYYSPIRYNYYDHHNYDAKRGRKNVAYTNGRRSFHKPGSRVHYKGGRSVVNKNYNTHRRSTAISQTNRSRNTTSRRSDNTTTRRVSNKVERATNKNNTRRVSTNYNRNSSNSSKKVSYKREASRSNSGNSKNYRSYSRKRTNTNSVASNSQHTSSRKHNSTARGNVSKRGRGL